MRSNKKNSESGNVLIIILMAIVLLGLLTAMLSETSEQQSDVISRQTMDNEINQMMTQVSTLGGALEQMVVMGAHPETLYTDLSLLKQDDAGFSTAPHQMKMYHPLGGGVTYMAASSTGASPVATSFNIVKDAIVTGVGATNAVVGDIVFTAKISTATYCARINEKIKGTTAIPTLVNADFTTLFTDGMTVTLNANCTLACANIPRQCVSNVDGDEWGYYSALFPG